MTSGKKRQAAFLNLHEQDDGHVSLWVNQTLLPNISTTLLKHQHPSLQDFSTACSQIYRGDKTKYKNTHCSIEQFSITAVPTDGNASEQIPGATLGFRKDILEAASKAFMSSENRAIGKIGLEFRAILRR